MVVRETILAPIPGYTDDVSWPQLILGIVGCLWIPAVAYRAWRASRSATDPGPVAVLPCYVQLLFAVAVTAVLQSGVFMTVSTSMSGHPVGRSVINAVLWGVHRVPLDGLAIFLMQHGAGSRAMKRAVLGGLSLGALNIATFIPAFLHFDTWGLYVVTAFCGLMSTAYAVLWLWPATTLYRRPAAIPYACFWSVQWGTKTLAYVLYCILPALSTPRSVEVFGDIAAVVYITAKGVLFNLIAPSVLYCAVVRDSRFWQGFHDVQWTWLQQLTAPLDGIRFSGMEAAGLATHMDALAKPSSAVHQLNFAQLQVGATLLGSGGQGRVYRGTFQGQPVAVKMVFCIELTPQIVEDFCTEAQLLGKLAHPNIVRSYGICVVPPTIALVLELCERGSLQSLLHSESAAHLSWRQKLELAAHCLRAIAFLHSRDTVHKDIKSANFLVTEDWTAKLSDLGVSEAVSPLPVESSSGKWLDASTRDTTLTMSSMTAVDAGFRGTLAYGAPEVLRGAPYTLAADVYSVTLVLWEIVSGNMPFDDEPVCRLAPADFAAAVAGEGDWRKYCGPMSEQSHQHGAVEGLRPLIPDTTPVAFAELLRAGWAAAPSARPSAQHLLDCVQVMLRALPNERSSAASVQLRTQAVGTAQVTWNPIATQRN